MTPRRHDLTDAEIETIVAEAIAAEACTAAAEAQPPASAIVWWRVQMRARREAAELAGKPITVVQALSIAAGIGLMLSVIGYAVAGVKGSLDWLARVRDSLSALAASVPVDLTGPWLTLTLTATLVAVVMVSIAAYVIFADE